MEQTKVCGNCEADVHVDAAYCPFCGADLLVAAPVDEKPRRQDAMFSNQSVQESLASLYKPPYVSRDRRGLGVPSTHRDVDYEPMPEPPPVQRETAAYDEEEEVTQERGGFLSLILLSLGGNLLTLGLLLLFFSDHGTLTLKWNGHAWFLYCLASLPLLGIGYRLLRSPPNS